jgi:hypothetical protein
VVSNPLLPELVGLDCFTSRKPEQILKQAGPIPLDPPACQFGKKNEKERENHAPPLSNSNPQPITIRHLLFDSLSDIHFYLSFYILSTFIFNITINSSRMFVSGSILIGLLMKKVEVHIPSRIPNTLTVFRISVFQNCQEESRSSYPIQNSKHFDSFQDFSISELSRLQHFRTRFCHV